MKYTCCERLMWHIIAPASPRCLSKQGWDALALNWRPLPERHDLLLRRHPCGVDGQADLTYLYAAMEQTLALVRDDGFRVPVINFRAASPFSG